MTIDYDLIRFVSPAQAKKMLEEGTLNETATGDVPFLTTGDESIAIRHEREGLCQVLGCKNSVRKSREAPCVSRARKTGKSASGLPTGPGNLKERRWIHPFCAKEHGFLRRAICRKDFRTLRSNSRLGIDIG